MRNPRVLMILDGFGVSPDIEGNAIHAARTPAMDKLFRTYPRTEILAHGTAVGLMPGLMGNSEVGHMNIGAGRVVAQDIDRINASIDNGSFFENETLVGTMRAAATRGTTLHLMGLLSDGGVHSSDVHYKALLDLAQREGLEGDRVVFHAFLDGRDTPPRSADGYLADLEAEMQRRGVGVVGTIVGRYWAMDRDTRWDRVQLAYDALVRGTGAPTPSAQEGLASAYADDENDEFVKPRIIGETPRVGRGDGVIFFNYRSDRARQLTEALLNLDFDAFAVEDLDLAYATMTRYKDTYPCPRAFEPVSLELVFGELAEREGLKQLRIAETEKYAHVTFFLNGGVEQPFEGEERILIPSPKVPTYDLQPEMNAPEVTDKVCSALADGNHDVYIMNFANADMVGHTGVFDAAVKAVEALDEAIGRIAEATLARDGELILTADHGNIEQMTDRSTGQAHTAHTINPVPLVVMSDRMKGRALRPGGRLADVIPTLLDLLEIQPPDVMNGNSLFSD